MLYKRCLLLVRCFIIKSFKNKKSNPKWLLFGGFWRLYLDVCFKLLARDVYRGNSWPALPDNGRLAQNYDNVRINRKPHCGVAGRCQRFVSSRLFSILFNTLQNSLKSTQLLIKSEAFLEAGKIFLSSIGNGSLNLEQH